MPNASPNLIERALPAARREARAAAKTIRQRLSYHGETKTSLFVFGCQRSGTNMLVDVLETSPLTLTFQEDDGRAFVHNRIKSVEVQRRLIARAACPVIAFKPIADSQNADVLLREHPTAKAVWIYRSYQDTSNSAVAKWGNGQVTLIRRLLKNDPAWTHWLADRMDAATLDFVRGLPLEPLTPHTASALKWWLRNKLYYDLALDHQPDRVRLVRYEDLVRDPVMAFAPLFAFVGLPFTPKRVEAVKAGSIRKAAFPDITPDVRDLCEELTARLDATLRRHEGRA